MSETTSSNAMEKFGFVKVLDEIRKSEINVKTITTDRHKSVRKYMRENQKDIKLQFDIWHVCKSIKKKLTEASKKAANKKLTPWIKAVCNHLWWSSATCNGDAELLKEKWMSIVFHTANKHHWPGCKHFKKCEHERYTKNKAT